jgi:hypothetical protein
MRPLLLLLLIGILTGCIQHQPNKKTADGPSEPEVTRRHDTILQPVEWLRQHNELDTTDSCIRKVISLVHYLDTETLSRIYTFERYPVSDTITGTPAPLDIKSSRSAREFRTNIRLELEAHGVNFAGKYSLVGVGMTGWGENRWIVDRTNGKAYEFPYWAERIEFRKNSNLVILHPKKIFLDFLQSTGDPGEACYYPQPTHAVLFADLRPAYLLWRNNKLTVLAPETPPLVVNEFWKGYFGEK